MLKVGRGSIVNLTSVHGFAGMPGHSLYAGTKGAIMAWTREVSIELARKNIRVNAVAPGFIETKMTAALPETVRQKMLEAIPMARFGLPDDVANVVLFLAGPASAYMTGQVLSISGGMVM